jgi:hypothetical protein
MTRISALRLLAAACLAGALFAVGPRVFGAVLVAVVEGMR